MSLMLERMGKEFKARNSGPAIMLTLEERDEIYEKKFGIPKPCRQKTI